MVIRKRWRVVYYSNYIFMYCSIHDVASLALTNPFFAFLFRSSVSLMQTVGEFCIHLIIPLTYSCERFESIIIYDDVDNYFASQLKRVNRKQSTHSEIILWRNSDARFGCFFHRGRHTIAAHRQRPPPHRRHVVTSEPITVPQKACRIADADMYHFVHSVIRSPFD
jgi:hypothetical protein